MKLSVIPYGSFILRKKNLEIDKNYKDLDKLVKDMFETMYFANGVGLAGPQVNKNIRLFIIDASAMEEDDPKAKDFKQVFINPKIIKEEGKLWKYKEGCLSVPEIREHVKRKPIVHIEYFDENFHFHKKTYDGVIARIIQHECDHLNGIVFVDKVSPIKKRLLKSKLKAISKGKITTNYKMKYN